MGFFSAVSAVSAFNVISSHALKPDTTDFGERDPADRDTDAVGRHLALDLDHAAHAAGDPRDGLEDRAGPRGAGKFERAER